MLSVNVPDFGELTVEFLVLDFNGTLAVDGVMQQGVKTALKRLSKDVRIYVVTADTFGKAAEELRGVDCELTVLEEGKQDRAKADFVNQLGPDLTVSIGNGRNDAMMLSASALGIAVILAEGASFAAIASADVVCTDIVSALELLSSPLRLKATLRK